jgi:hypothetical protein
MKKPAIFLALCCGAVSLASAATFHTPVSITSSNSNAFFPLNNLIEGPGVGYDAAEPHNAPGGGHTWVTDAPGGFPSDYIGVAGPPILVMDLGGDFLLTEISTWGYTTGNANGIKTFDLRFATSAQGPSNFGAPQTGFTAAFTDIERDSHPLVPVTARYVEFTGTSTYYSNGGLGPPAGGDRAGLGEIAFAVVPEPSAALMGALGLVTLLRRRR